MSKVGRGRLWDAGAVGILILTLIMLVYMILIGLRPGSPLNLLPPSTPIMVVYVPSATWPAPTPSSPAPQATSGLVSTATPTKSAVTPRLTRTPVAAVTLTSQATSTPTDRPTVTAGPTPRPSLTPSPTRSPFTFTASINYQVHPVLTCDWTGMAGTAVDLQGQPAAGYVVQVTGADRTTRQVAVGSSPDYGPGGWELRLGGRETAGIWRVQLVTQSAPNRPMSETYEIVLPGVCQKNLAFVRFQQNH